MTNGLLFVCCLNNHESLKKLNQINGKIATIKTVTEICQAENNHCWLNLLSV